MLLIAVGGIRPRTPLVLPVFAALTAASHRQARRAPGCVHTGLHRAGGLFFSFTAWETPAAMRAYAAGWPHRAAMRLVPRWMESHGFHHFTVDTLPDWPTALDRWRAARNPVSPAPATP